MRLRLIAFASLFLAAAYPGSGQAQLRPPGQLPQQQPAPATPGPAAPKSAGAEEIIDRIKPEELAESLSKVGFHSEVRQTKEGQKFVVSFGFFLSGATVIAPDVCDTGGCQQVTFVTWLKPPADYDWITSWHLRMPGLVQVGLRKAEQDLQFSYTVSLQGGVTRNHIIQSAFAFVTIVNQRFKSDKIAGRPTPKNTVTSPDLMERIKPAQMVDILNKAGYPSTLQTTNGETYIVAKFYPTLSGKVGFDGCDERGCNLVYYLLFLGKDPGLGPEWVNSWNLKRNYVSAVLKNGDLAMVMWSQMFGGVRAEHLQKDAQLFIALVNSAEKFDPNQ